MENARTVFLILLIVVLALIVWRLMGPGTHAQPCPTSAVLVHGHHLKGGCD
jgi:hypothetical protein